MNQVDLIKAAQQGQLSAFNKLIMAHQALVYNIAYRIMGNPEAAADATQESFLKAFKAIKQYRGGSFKGWLLRIVTNTCYDQLRYNKRRPTKPLEKDNDEADHAAYFIDSAERPEEALLRHELGDMIQQAINRLPPEQRLILVLSDVEGFSYQEIMEATDLVLGTVKSRLNRARTKLKAILKRQELLPQKYR